jgi:eukaryotic-like serine/threonine-protein kinase
MTTNTEPQALGRFRIEGQFSSEGPGKLYRGLTDTGRPVLLSIVPATMGRNAALSPDSGLRLVDFGTLDSGDIYLAYDVPEGETLTQRLHREPMGWEAATRAFLPAIDMLAATHGRGQAYGELAPSKMIVHPQVGVVLIGKELKELMRSFDRRKEDGNTPGMDVAPYLSPERARGERATPASDIFAMGSILFETVAGRRAFPAPDLLQVLYQVQNAQVPELRSYDPAIPVSLSDAIAATLSKDPSRRPSIVTLRDALNTALSEPEMRRSPSRRPTPISQMEPVPNSASDVKTAELPPARTLANARAMMSSEPAPAPIEPPPDATVEVVTKPIQIPAAELAALAAARVPPPAVAEALPAREVEAPAPTPSPEPSQETTTAPPAAVPTMGYQPAEAAPVSSERYVAARSAPIAAAAIAPTFTDEWFRNSQPPVNPATAPTAIRSEVLQSQPLQSQPLQSEPVVSEPIPARKSMKADTKIVIGALVASLAAGGVLLWLALGSKAAPSPADEVPVAGSVAPPVQPHPRSAAAAPSPAPAPTKTAATSVEHEVQMKTEPALPPPSAADLRTKHSRPAVHHDSAHRPETVAHASAKPARSSAPERPTEAHEEPAPAPDRKEIKDPFGSNASSAPAKDLKEPF